jgi:hypothetical protein
VDYNVAILLPRSRLGRGGNGRLLIRSQPIGGGTDSDTLRIALRESPRIFAVAGDSMAWGQGLGYQEKWFWRTYDKARTDSADGEFDRLYVRAHSASHLNGGAASIDTAARGCVPSATDQELPLGADTVQCQLVQIARPECVIDAAMLGQPGVVPDVSCEQTPNADAEALLAPLAADMSDPQPAFINHGARVDFLFLDGCINDVGAVRIHTDLDGSLNALINDIDAECDVANSVPDLRTEFPNADIVWLGYHRTWSDASAVLNPLRCPASIAVNPANIAIFPFNFILSATTQDAVDDIAERVTLFKERSDQKLAESVGALAGEAPGRGRIQFVPLAFFGADHAAYAPQSDNWELNCLDPALPTQDTVLTQRYADCEATIDVLTPQEIAAGIDWLATDWSAETQAYAALMFCERAPFLHPDREANVTMGDLVIDALGEAL